MSHECTCAVCMGYAPWTATHPECMHVMFGKTAEAVADGTATPIPQHVVPTKEHEPEAGL